MTPLVIIGEGSFHAEMAAVIQPAKFAAMESVWETQKNAPYNLILIPDADNEKNSVESIGIPSFLSIIAYHDSNAEVKGLKEFPKEDRPPVTPTFLSFRLMVVLGFLFVVLSLLGVVFAKNDSLEKKKAYLTIMLFAIPLPYIAGQLGWLVAELGRQPWIVYGLLKTSDAVSKSIDTAQVAGSLIGFTLLYGSLAVVDIFLLTRNARKGPDDDLSFIIQTSRS